jgi:hypothetical protein
VGLTIQYTNSGGAIKLFVQNAQTVWGSLNALWSMGIGGSLPAGKAAIS